MLRTSNEKYGEAVVEINYKWTLAKTKGEIEDLQIDKRVEKRLGKLEVPILKIYNKKKYKRK